MAKLTHKVRVKNQQGLHTQPATAIVRMLHNRKSAVYFTYKQERINAKSILGILLLAAHRNSLITIDVDGEDAEDTMKVLIEAFEAEFK